MKLSLEQVLDTCLTQLNRGDDLEAVLADHPKHADELRPMLAAAALVRLDVPAPTRKATRKPAFMAAVAERRRVVEAADGYVVEVKAGVPVDELLERATPEMRPVVHAAWRMASTEPPEPAPEKVAAGKARLMALAEERRRARAMAAPGVSPRLRYGLSGLVHGLRPRPSAMRRAWSGAVAALIIVAFLGAGLAGVGSATASSLPGDSFYGVKEFGRSAQLLFAFDPERRAELNIQFSGARLAEIRALATKGREVPLEVLEEWLRGQSSALADIQKLPLGQRRLMAEMLLSVAAEREVLSSGLRGAVADPRALDAILSESDDLMARARGATGEETATGTPDPAVREPAAAKRPDRQLPPEKTMSRRPRPEPKAEPPVAPVAIPAQVVDEPEAAPPNPEPEFVQMPANEPAEQPDRDRNEPRPPVAAEPTEPPAENTDAPPAFNQPPLENPTDTPEPGEPAPPVDPQGGGDEPVPDPELPDPEPEPTAVP